LAGEAFISASGFRFHPSSFSFWSGAPSPGAECQIEFKIKKEKVRAGRAIDLNPNSEVDRGIEKPRRKSIVVGRVTPCAPRLQPDGTNYPRCYFHNQLKIMAFYKSHRSNFGVRVKTEKGKKGRQGGQIKKAKM